MSPNSRPLSPARAGTIPSPKGVALFAILVAGLCYAVAPIAADEVSSEIVHLEFSSDGRFLASLDSDGTLSVFHTRSRKTALLLTNRIRGENVAWRPGTHELALALDRGQGWDIWLLDVDTEKEERLTRHPALDASPQWIDGGDTLVFVTYRSGSADLFQMNMTDRVAVPLVEKEYDQWQPLAQPGGNAVAYLSLETERVSLWICDPDQPPFRIADFDPLGRFLESVDFAWDRQGKSLLYVDDASNPNRLHAFDFGERRDRLLSESAEIRRPALDEKRGRLFYDSPEGLIRHRWKGRPFQGRSGREILTFDGLALSRPTLGCQGRRPLLAVTLAQGRIAALGRAPDGPFFPLGENMTDRMLLAEEWSDIGRLGSALRIYRDSMKLASDADEIAAIHVRRAAAFRKAGRYDDALEELRQVAKSTEATIAPGEILALQGEILLFEVGDTALASATLGAAIRESTDGLPAAEEALAILETGKPSLIESYVEAHRALRRDDIEACLDAARTFAQEEPASPRVRDAVLSLLNDPYRDEILNPEEAERFDRRKYRERIAEILILLDRAAQTGAGSPSVGDPEIDRLRESLLQILLDTRRLAEARAVALRLLASKGPDAFAAKDFLDRYLDPEGHTRIEHALLAKVLASPEVAPALEERFQDDTVARTMLSLAHTKSALLEGDFESSRRSLDKALASFEDFYSEEFRSEIADLQVYLYLFEAKYYEGQSLWDAAAKSYLHALALAHRHVPDRTKLCLDLDLALSEVTLKLAPDDARKRMQAILRGMGDPLLNPTIDDEQLLTVARNLRQLATQPDGAMLEPFLLFHMGAGLMQAGRFHQAARCLDQSLALDPPPALRAAVHWYRASLAHITGDVWGEYQACQDLLKIVREPFLEDAIRMRSVEPLLSLGMEDQARALLVELSESAALAPVRESAARRLEELSHAAPSD
ncbi:hypothetical protein JW916_08700 [Candidatus Sumerlaeota bacterium]|nr:hypothetical protein [Candidatus Sumerlaeota bacterium]